MASGHRRWRNIGRALRQRSTRRSIGTRLLWSYMLSSTLPLLLVGTLLIGLGFNTQRASVYDNQVTQAGSISREIANYLSSFDQQILRLNALLQPTLPEANLSAVVGDLFRANSPNLRSIAIINADGQEVLHQQALQEIIRFLPREDRSADTLVTQALAGRGQRSVSRAEDGTPVFVLLLPLRDSVARGVGGVVIAEVSAVPAQYALRSVRGPGKYLTYLVDESRRLLLSADPDITQSAPGVQLLFVADTDASEYVGARGQMVVGARAPLLPTRWSVVVERPSTEAFAASRRSGLILATLVGIVGMLALLSALWQARQLIWPLQELRAGASVLGSGHLEHRIEVEGNDELTELAQTFNQMAEHLQESRAEIEQQNERLRSGLALARDIQVGLLPTAAPWNAEVLAVHARSLPAYEVGGDFYTYMALSHGRAAIAIGDISGKGVGAALLMALTSSLVESHGRQSDRPAQVLTALNNALTPRMKANRMNAALLYAVLEPASRTFTVANAGMISPMVVSDNGVRMVDVGGLPIGSFAGAFYSEQEVALEPGETLLFVSDGVVEAHNEAGELFGFERLEALLVHLEQPDDTQQLVGTILEAVQSFMGAAEQHDDITVVAVRPARFSYDYQMQEREFVNAER